MFLINLHPKAGGGGLNPGLCCRPLAQRSDCGSLFSDAEPGLRVGWACAPHQLGSTPSPAFLVSSFSNVLSDQVSLRGSAAGDGAVVWAARTCLVPEACFSPDRTKRKSPLQHTEVLCSIPARSLLSPSYCHSFGITENYIIFLEQPFKLDILKMATAYIRGVSWASCLHFHREDKVSPGWAS